MKLDFSKSEYDYIIENAGLTEIEEQVFCRRRKGWELSRIATDLDYCERQIARYHKSIKLKITKCIKEKAQSK